MCEKQKRIDELESELAQSHQREAELFKTIAEGKNHESQVKWRPWQMMVVGMITPTLLSLAALITSLIK
ncbi:hypothetical protein AB4391_01430 [Vibrio lentus]|uniref:Uncharacterized protein n=1 Tax=Vibrio lentus TaxID=136468 RepID=A0A2N7K1I6_9VIBR|nr:hypothetical protein [Vibrio lentus]PMM67183.1 hypothetical protein BCT49_10485 [Vibrio lentus]